MSARPGWIQVFLDTPAGAYEEGADPAPAARRARRPVRAHPDLATAHREADAQAHVRLGARLEQVFDHWTVLTAPGGQVYCLTDRDPFTGTAIARL